MQNLKSFFGMAMILIISSTSFAQTTLTGKWKMVSVEIAEQIYVNVEKDSIHLTRAFWESADATGTMDSTTKATMIGALKSSLTGGFKDMVFSIDDKGGIYETKKNEKIGQYNAAKNTITFSDAKSKKQTTVPVEIKDDLLKFTSPEEEDKIAFWCRKMKDN